MALKFNILILAGGRGSRMGGQDKGLVEYHGKPLITHMHTLATHATQKYGGHIYISCNRNISYYRTFAPTITDTTPDFSGPLAGIYATLKHIHTLSTSATHLLVLPIDTPRLTLSVVDALVHSAHTKPSSVHVVDDGVHIHPTLMILPMCYILELQYALEHKNYKVGKWIKQREYQKVPIKTTNILTNYNTLNDLKK